jgi:mono/diheme cytochrome c family protein
MVVTVGATVAQAALPPEKLALLPRASTAPVDFARDIQPIFEASCVQCHGRGKNKGLFSLETRQDFVEGGETGVAAVAGKSAESLVVAMISGLNPRQCDAEEG